MTFDEWKLEVVIKGNIIEDLHNSIYINKDGLPCINVSHLVDWLSAAYQEGFEEGVKGIPLGF